ncbi:hypothetical protein ACQRIU_004720 [Beauveria bassiana]
MSLPVKVIHLLHGQFGGREASFTTWAGVEHSSKRPGSCHDCRFTTAVQTIATITSSLHELSASTMQAKPSLLSIPNACRLNTERRNYLDTAALSSLDLRCILRLAVRLLSLVTSKSVAFE